MFLLQLFAGETLKKEKNMTKYSTNYNEKIRKAHLRLIKKDVIFFGIQSYQFNWNIRNDMNKNIICMVEFPYNKPDEKFLINNQISFNEYYLNKFDFLYENIAYVFVHELLHILKKHMSRKGNRIHEIWSVACDHVIERELKKRLPLKPFKDNYIIIDKLHEALPNCTEEEAYEWLKKETNLVKISLNIDYIEIDEKNGEKKKKISSPLQKIPQKQIQEIENEIRIQARILMEQVKSKGKMEGKLIEYINEILKVDVPWDVIVEKAIKNNIKLTSDNRSWRKLHNNYRIHGINIPGYIGDTEKYPDELIITIDTSGSINKNDLKKFSNIIVQSSKYFTSIRTISHDIPVTDEQIFSKDNIHTFLNYISKTGFKGRGGTSHTEVFKRIEEINKKNSNISLVISLTDNYSNIKKILDNQEWLKTIKLIILHNSKDIDIDNKNVSQIKF